MQKRLVRNVHGGKVKGVASKFWDGKWKWEKEDHLKWSRATSLGKKLKCNTELAVREALDIARVLLWKWEAWNEVASECALALEDGDRRGIANSYERKEGAQPGSQREIVLREWLLIFRKNLQDNFFLRTKSKSRGKKYIWKRIKWWYWIPKMTKRWKTLTHRIRNSFWIEQKRMIFEISYHS